jgi:hypothetical protein
LVWSWLSPANRLPISHTAAKCARAWDRDRIVLSRQHFGRRVLRADKAVSYGNLMEAMNGLRTAGYLKVALVGLEADVPR